MQLLIFGHYPFHKTRTMDNVQKINNYINIASSHTLVACNIRSKFLQEMDLTEHYILKNIHRYGSVR
jgi:ABC-type enterochelin transport system ATPase subunit